VPAHIEESVELTMAIARQDDGILAHIRVEEVVDPGHQALVPDHQPGAAEDFLHLLVVDGLVAEDAAVDLARRRIDDGVFLRGAHAAIPLDGIIGSPQGPSKGSKDRLP
jgi:hypothetical protein